MSNQIANYHQELAAFEQFLDPHYEKPILCFCGESGSGKTTLLSTCLSKVPKNFIQVRFDFKDSGLSIAEFFYRTGDRLKWEKMPSFSREVESLSTKPNIQIQGNRQTGMGNSITVALTAEKADDREQRRMQLTHAWFQDIRAFADPVLMVLDTFEKSCEEVKSWFCGTFLDRAIQTKEKMKILVAGQKTPDTNNITWGDCCNTYKLHGVPEAVHWLPVLKAQNKKIDAPDPLSWMAGICHALKGNPSEIAKIIESLPNNGAA